MGVENPLAMRADDDRYEVLRKLGAGGSGSVYLVRDRETSEQLALKRLHRADDQGIVRLKREFRSLTNVDHPNVVRLYDLGRAHDVWFLTMEYIDGADLAAHLARDVSTTATWQRRRTGSILDADELARIVTAFLQLANGIRALHRAQVLHRDLKPSNVLVANDRVVVVDFGLALEVGDDAATVTLDGAIAGTPAYVAPEQLEGRDWGEPNDWYSFGVMLYETLSGRLPIGGRLQELLRRKLTMDPVPIEQLVPGLPPALCELCSGLLQRQPDKRPSGDAVLTALQACVAAPERAEHTTAERTISRQRTFDQAFIGRDLERAQLQRALADVTAGGFAAVHVSGVSGAGKSALVEQFLDEATHAHLRPPCMPPLILRGRCYERETVPFKALDAAMDALVTQLSREEDVFVSHILPSAIGALTQLFPALNRLSVVKRLVAPNQRTVAAPHAREEAEAALRDLFLRLGSHRSIVLFIDDLHWGDLDSARIIKSWMEPPGIPGMLLLLCYRSDEVETSRCLRLLAREGARSSLERRVPLGPLGGEYIRALCAKRLTHVVQDERVLGEITEHIVSEAGGSPYLASQLAALASTDLQGGQPGTLDQLTVEALVLRRTALLSAPAQRLLNVLSVASRPLSTKLALRLAAAAEIGRAALHELSGLGLIRTHNGEPERLLSVYHDRLREGVLHALSASERAELDRELFRALEAEGAGEAAWLHTLALGAGEHAAALRYGLEAAQQATQALAFERAAQLYRACVALCPDGSAQSSELWQSLAVALAHSGNGRQAAAAYLEAAQRAEGERALQLERSAASHLLRSGSFEEGELLVNKVLAALRLETPRSLAGLLAAIAWERTQLALRGLDFKPARVEDVPFWTRYGGELCGTLSIELQPYDPLRAALFQARSLRIALGAGVPELIARALCVAATVAAVGGDSRGGERAEALLARSSELARELNSPLVDGNIHSARAVCAMLTGRMRDVLVHAAEAERMFREVNASDEGEYYHRATVQAARITAFLQLGQPQEGRAVLTSAVNEAKATENVSALLLLSPLRTRLDITDDQPERSVPRLESERAQLPPQRFGLLHVYHMSSVMRVACATGDHAWAVRWIGEDWQRFGASIWSRGGYFSVIMPALHARLLLNQSVAAQHSAAEARALVADDLRSLRRTKAVGADGCIARTYARLALIAGDRRTAQTQIQLSARCFEQFEVTADEAARDRYVYGALIGGAEGAALQASALGTLRSFGVANPQRDLASYYPELFVKQR